MAIRKPGLSVTEARRLASIRTVPTPTAPVCVDKAASAPTLTSASSSSPPSPSVGGTLEGTHAVSTPERAPTSPQAKAVSPSPMMPTVSPSGKPLRDTPGKAQVFVYAHLPAPGVSPIFEMLCRDYPSQRALQMILRRALQDYDDFLENSTFQKMAMTYETDETNPRSFVQTSRMMQTDLIAVAQNHFNPLGLESTRAFGLKLATAALAVFFSRETSKPHWDTQPI